MTVTRICYGGTMTLYESGPWTPRVCTVHGEEHYGGFQCQPITLYPEPDAIPQEDTPKIGVPTHEHLCTIGRKS